MAILEKRHLSFVKDIQVRLNEIIAEVDGE